MSRSSPYSKMTNEELANEYRAAMWLVQNSKSEPTKADARKAMRDISKECGEGGVQISQLLDNY